MSVVGTLDTRFACRNCFCRLRFLMDKDIKSFDATAAKILLHLDEECPGRIPAFLSLAQFAASCPPHSSRFRKLQVSLRMCVRRVR